MLNYHDRRDNVSAGHKAMSGGIGHYYDPAKKADRAYKGLNGIPSRLTSRLTFCVNKVLLWRSNGSMENCCLCLGGGGDAILTTTGLTIIGIASVTVYGSPCGAARGTNDWLATRCLCVRWLRAGNRDEGMKR